MSDLIDQAPIVLGWVMSRAVELWREWLYANPDATGEELQQQYAARFPGYLDAAFAEYPDNPFSSREELKEYHSLACKRSADAVRQRIALLVQQEMEEKEHG